MESKDWYLIKLFEEYDRSYIQMDIFITQNPDNYLDNSFLKNGSWQHYTKEKIKVKDVNS